MKNIINGFGFIYGSSIQRKNSKIYGTLNSIVIDNNKSSIDISDVDASDGTTTDSFCVYELPKKLMSSKDTFDVSMGGKSSRLIVKNVPEANSASISGDYIPLTNIETDSASYELLRTNPKLTGNIKVVIDSEKNIYIDTFKVNDALSKEKYRKVPVSYKDYYGSNVMSIFRNVQSKDLYDVPQKYHSLFTVTNNFKEQYADIYRSGTSLNTDKMYKENYSLLAPLKIGETLPDFFVVFKIDNTAPMNLSSTDTMKYLIKNGKQIAFFDFREGTKLGTYIRNIQDNAKKFTSEIYVAKNGTEDDNYENIFCGISVDKGVVANIYESVAFNDAKNQVAYNNYFSKAYERNRLISPNIINFEYMFDDEGENQFSINTYYGLYLKFNPISEDIYCFSASIDNNGDPIKTENYVFKRNGEFVNKTDNVYSIEFPDDIISAYISKDWIRRRTENNKYTVLDDTLPDINNKYCVGDNLASLYTKEIVSKGASVSYSSFATITLNSVLEAGEHLKVICLSKNDDEYADSVYEIIFSDASLYEKNSDGLSDEIINYYTHNYKTYGGSIYSKSINVHRVCYSFSRLDGESEQDAIKRQVNGINKAFKKFTNCPVKSLGVNDTTISIVEITSENSHYGELYLQRITPDILNGNEVITDEELYREETDKVTYFGEYSVSPVIINPLSDNDNDRSWVYKDESCLGFCPIDFEMIGVRLSYIIKFVKIDGYDVYEVNLNSPSDDILYSQLYFIDDRIYADKTPRTPIPTEYDKFVLSYKTYDEQKRTVVDTNREVNLITSFNNTNLKLVKIKNSDKNGEFGSIDKINLYLPYELSYGICGILSVKDFDFNVMDNYGDESESTSWYINKDSDSSIDNINSSYLSEEYNNGRRYNDISLVNPYCMKWRFFNSDKKGNAIKLYYTDSKCGYEKYIENVSLLENDSENTCMQNDKLDITKTYKQKYIRELLMDGSLYIQDIIYNESIRDFGNISDIEHIKVYPTSNSEIEFIYRGIKLKLSLKNEEIISAEDLANFNIYIYESAYSYNENEWELFIDKENMCMLVIHYNIQNTIDSDGNVLEEDANDQNNNVIFMNNTISENNKLRWCRINGTFSSKNMYMSDGKLLMPSESETNIPNGEDVAVLLHCDRYTIRGKMSSETLENTIIVDNPYIFSTILSDKEKLTDDMLDNYCYGYDELVLFALSKSDGMIYKNDTKLNFYDLGVFIKNEGEAYSDYTNMNMVSVTSELAPKLPAPSDDRKYYRFYQTHFVPETTDIFEFTDIQNNNSSREFGFINSKYANIALSKVNDIAQMWIEKYSGNTNYCFDTSIDDRGVKQIEATRCSFDCINNYNIMMNPLSKTFNYTHTYDENGKEKSMFYEGYRTGYFIKTFFNSLAIQLRSPIYKNIEITTWSNTRVKRNKLRFDVTNSLINMIINSATFNELWTNIRVNDVDSKLNFIKKSIIPNINISTNDTITVYVKRYKNIGIIKSTPSNTFIEGMEEIKNVIAELISEGGNYYVEVTTNRTINGTYYIKYNIKI